MFALKAYIGESKNYSTKKIPLVQIEVEISGIKKSDTLISELI